MGMGHNPGQAVSATYEARKAAAVAQRAAREANPQTAAETYAARKAAAVARRAGFAGVEPGGGFSTPPIGPPQAFPRPGPLPGPYPGKTNTPYPDMPTTSPVQGRPALPRPMPGPAAPAPGGLLQNLPVPPYKFETDTKILIG